MYGVLPRQFKSVVFHGFGAVIIRIEAQLYTSRETLHFKSTPIA